MVGNYHDIPPPPESSKSVNDGGSAFPEPNSAQCGGMSLRDYFAAKFYAAMIAGGYWPIDSSREDQAHMAYVHADAMLAERAK